MKPPDARIFKFLYTIGLGSLVGRLILLLTTTGRISGRIRTTALQYEEMDGYYYLGSSKGLNADWVKNILANPNVAIRVKKITFQGLAEVVTDSERIADFLQLRLTRHPKMVALIMKAEGLPESPSRSDLMEYTKNLSLVIVKPCI